MFCWRAATFLEQVRVLQPACHSTVSELAMHPERLEQLFPSLPKISLDYAIMEPVSQGMGTANIFGVALSADWRDVGGYSSLAEVLNADSQANAFIGNVIAVDAQRNVIMNNDADSLVVVAGVSGLVIVRTPKVTLVIPEEQSERVKELVAEVSDAAADFV